MFVAKIEWREMIDQYQNNRVLSLIVLMSILFLSSYFAIASAETMMCRNDDSDKSCKGSERTDVLVGNKNSNRMNGLEGTDYILGLFGNDYMIGYNGSDTLVGLSLIHI